MALQSSGPISLGNLKTEFGDTGSSSLSEFYRGGSLVPNTGTNTSVPTSGEIQLTDFYNASATAATWAWQQTYSSIVEDVTRTFIIEDTSGTTTSGTFNWSINGTTADFSAVSGSGTINASSEGSFNVTPIFDGTLDGPENFTLTVTFGGSTILTQAFTVTDPSVTINAVRSASSVNEGNAFTFSASATEAITGTVNFTLTGSATDGSDYNTSGASTGTTGQFTFSNSTTSDTLTVTTVADSTTEGSENVICTITNDNVTNGYISSIGTASRTVTINDTSQTPASPTYNATPAANNVNEGSSLTINVATTNVSNGTTLYWTILNGTSSNADFSSISGSFSINSNAGSFSVSPVADSTTEGAQTFRVRIRTGSTSGPIVDTTSFITINDTSQTPVTPTYAFSAGSYNVTEGSSSSITVNTTNVSNGTTLYWTISNSTTTNADFSSTSGNFTINSNTGSFSVSAASDSNNESTETATLQLRTGSTSGTIQDTATLNVLNDASINLTPATDTLFITDEDGTVSANGGIQLEGTSSADTYNIGTIIDGFQTTEHSNVWITGGDPADYEARVTVTSGTVNSNVSFTNFGTGTSVGTWSTLSGTNYVWAWETTSQLTNTFTITLQIRDSATQTVQDSATVQFNFETQFIPG